MVGFHSCRKDQLFQHRQDWRKETAQAGRTCKASFPVDLALLGAVLLVRVARLCVGQPKLQLHQSGWELGMLCADVQAMKDLEDAPHV